MEKDHRKVMIGFGIPEEVANYLHGFNDKYSIWFANQIKTMPEFQAAKDKVNWIRVNLQTDMTGIVDWVTRVPNTILKAYDWEKANKLQKEWHESLQQSSLEGIEKNNIIKQYNDGYYWVDLESDRCDDEKELMGHCATTDSETMYSLRRYDKDTNSISAFVTMGVNPSQGVWRQAKGAKNSKPKEQHWKYIVDILIDHELFRFWHEYGYTDFSASDFRSYVDEHREDFPNADEIIEKIDEHKIGLDKFEAVIPELKYYSVYVSADNYDDDADYVSVSCSLYISIPKKEVPYYVGLLDADTDSLESMLRDVSDFHLTDFEISEHENTFNIHSYVELNDDTFRADDDGLAAFKRGMGDMEYADGKFDAGDILDIVKKWAKIEGVIESEYITFVNSVVRDYEAKFSGNGKGEIDIKLIITSLKDLDKKSYVKPNTRDPFLAKIFDGYKIVLRGDVVSEDIIEKMKEERSPVYYLLYAVRENFKGHDFGPLDVKVDDRDLICNYTFTFDDEDEYNWAELSKKIDILNGAIPRIDKNIDKTVDDLIIPACQKTKVLGLNDVTYDISKGERGAGETDAGDPNHETKVNIFYKNKLIDTVVLPYYSYNGSYYELVKDSEKLRSAIHERLHKYPLLVYPPINDGAVQVLNPAQLELKFESAVKGILNPSE